MKAIQSSPTVAVVPERPSLERGTSNGSIAWKRWLTLGHRWLGIAVCLLFALWFASGIVMMYVKFPRLTAAERLAALPPIEADDLHISPRDAFAVSGLTAPPRQVRISMALDRPVYHFVSGRNEAPVMVYGDDGSRLESVSPEQALAAASQFSGSQRARIAKADLQIDQWTVGSTLDVYRPFYQVRVEDGRGTELYVSTRTGEVVRDTNRRERALNWVGAITHWFYPLILRQYGEAWRQVVIWTSFIGALAAMSGMVLGVARFRFKKKRPEHTSIPYRGLMRWHYITGALFGTVAMTWAFSGMISLNPLQMFPRSAPDRNQLELLSGGPFNLDNVTFPFARALAFAREQFIPKEAEIVQFDGRPYYLFHGAPETTLLVSADSGPLVVREHFDTAALIEMAPALMPGVKLAEAVELTAFDSYYYTRKPGEGQKRLPVVRARFNDDAQTWFHLDPYSGAILDKPTARNRLRRWLFNGLHSFDFPILINSRPLWDIVVISFSLGGMLLSLIAVRLSWRRLRGHSARYAGEWQAFKEQSNHKPICLKQST